MNILIVAPRYNSGDISNFVYMFPLGLGYISAVLKQAGHEVECLNLNHYNGKVSDLVGKRLLANRKFDFVCTGGLSDSYHQAKSITDAVRNTGSDIGVILGGGMISSEPEIIFNALEPDYIVIGEGENTIRELLSCLEKKEEITNVDGIGFRGETGQFQITKKQAPIMDLDALPLPDFDGFEFETYLSRMRPTDFYFYDIFDSPRVYPIIGSRGCPFLCTFCFHPLGPKYRQRSIDSIMAELEFMVIKHKINIIAVYDELFTYDQDRVYEFCARIKELFKKLSWECRWTCQMRVDGLDEACLKTMKDAGCHMVSYGFESYSQTVLKSMRKSIKPEQIGQAIQITQKNGVSLQANFIFGDTAETSETAKETLDFWKDQVDAGVQLGFITAYPGTKIFKRCVEKGVIKNILAYIINPLEINTTETMTDHEIRCLKFEIYLALLKYRPLSTPHSLRKTSTDTHHGLVKSIYNVTVKCPYCGQTIEYKNYLILFHLFFFHTRYCRNCSYRFFLVSKPYKLLNHFLRLFFVITGNRLGKIVYEMFLVLKKRADRLKPTVKQVLKYHPFRKKVT